MPHELIYTSAPRGLKPGSTGYCTVAQTSDLPKDLAEQLEGISHYRHLRVDDPAGNPVAFSHSVLTTGYTVHHVLSRIADSGLDHSGRSNFLAHHVVFDPNDPPDAGPAWLCEQARMFVQKWDGSVRRLQDDRAIPSGRSEAAVCSKWQRLTGDAGWGGVLAGATNAAEPAYLIYEPGQDVIGLLAESMALLQPEARWGVTFNTYFTGKAVRTTCQWRCVTADSAEAREALAARRGVVIRIDQPMSGVPTGPLVEVARTGEVDRPAPKRPPAPPASVRLPRQFDVVEDLPSAPVAPASRPIRTRPSEPLPEVEDSQYDLPVAAAPRGSSGGKGGVGPLLLGILLGGLLILALTAIVELVGEKSFAGDYAKLKLEKQAESDAKARAEERAEDSARAKRAADEETHRFSTTLQQTSKELRAAKETIIGLESKLSAVSQVASTGGGFFEGIPAWVNQAVVNIELKEAKERVKTLETELMAAKAKPPAPVATGGVHVVTRVETPPPVEAPLPGIVVDPAKAKLDVVGFNGNNRFEWEPNEKRVRILKDGSTAIFAVNQDGGITWSHTVIGAGIPSYGYALLRIDTGKNVQYVQFFKRNRGDLTTLDVKAPSNFANGKATYRIETHLPKQMGKLAARNAVLRIGADQYELEAGADAGELKSVPSAKPPVTLKVEDGGVIIVEVDRAIAGAPLSFETLDIIRMIEPVPEIGFPGYEQVLVSYKK